VLFARSGHVQLARCGSFSGLGVDVVRVNVRWNDIALRRPARPTKHTDRAYRWDPADALLNGLHIHGITPIVTLVGTPRWANGGRDPSWAAEEAR
jgi:hypothetical protein